MTAQAVERARDEVDRIALCGLDIAAYFERTGEALRRAVGFDGFCSMTVDPATMLLTSHIAHGSVRPEDVPRLGRNEFLEEDVNKFAVLARRRRPAGVLTQATSGRPETSPRYREILRPNGFGDELRAALIDEGLCWGWIALYRRSGHGDFRGEDTDLAAGLSNALAQGLRRAILLGASTAGEAPDAPGLILIGPDGVESMTPQAERWLATLIAETPADGELPAVVNGVVYRTRRAAADGGPATGARARVPAAGGTWVTIHGSLLGGTDRERIAIILEPARSPEVAPIISAAYGLTPREREVTQLVLQGLSTAELAATLHLSGYTVQDHLKAIFDKVGVRSRRELAAQVFFQHYVPRLQGGAPIAANGWFA